LNGEDALGDVACHVGSIGVEEVVDGAEGAAGDGPQLDPSGAVVDELTQVLARWGGVDGVGDAGGVQDCATLGAEALEARCGLTVHACGPSCMGVS
jgi:hypothetical protein